jgi:signal peptidase I
VIKIRINDLIHKNPKSLNSASVGTGGIARNRRILHYSKYTVIIVLGLWLTLTYIISPVAVSGTSMLPTLQNGDILLEWKLPKTWAEISGGQYIPARANIVIVYDSHSNKKLVKRVIGLPNEQISISNNRVTVYKANNPSGFNPDAAPYGKNLLPTAGLFSGSTGDGQIFVMGDNRALGGSVDSRTGVGDIPAKNIKGHIVARIYPLNKITLF